MNRPFGGNLTSRLSRIPRLLKVLVPLLLFAIPPRTSPASALAADPPSVSLGSIQGQFFFNPGAASFNPTFNITSGTPPIFTQSFPLFAFNPPSAAGIACATTLGVNEGTKPFTDVLSSPSCSTDVAQGNGYQAGLGTLTAFEAVFISSVTVSAPVNVTFPIYSDDGWILSVGADSGGQQPTRVSGEMTNPPTSGTGPFTGYPVMGAYNQVSVSNPPRTVTISFSAAGTYPMEVDYAENGVGPAALTVSVAVISNCLLYAAAGDSVANGQDLVTGQPYRDHLLQDHLLSLGFSQAPACYLHTAQNGASTRNYLEGGIDLFGNSQIAQRGPVLNFGPNLITLTIGADDNALPTLLHSCMQLILAGNITGPGGAVACEQQILNDASSWNVTTFRLTNILQDYRQLLLPSRPNLVVAVTNYYNPLPDHLDAQTIQAYCSQAPNYIYEAACKSRLPQFNAVLSVESSIISRLNTTVAQVVGTVGAQSPGHFVLVDISKKFIGHCTVIDYTQVYPDGTSETGNLGCGEDQTWIAPNQSSFGASTHAGVHPNEKGHECIADLIWVAVRGTLGSSDTASPRCS
jgi:lysophospholipase L1-like esterase